MARTVSKTIAVIINPAAGGLTRLGAAFAALSAGQSAAFTLPNWDAANWRMYGGWTSHGFHSANLKKIRFLTKNVAGYAPYLYEYDEVADAMSLLYTGDTGYMQGSNPMTGHPYEAHTMDPETGDYYFLTWQKEILKWHGSGSGAWTLVSTGSDPWSGASSPITGLTFVKGLFGPGTKGLVVRSNGNIRCFKLGDQTTPFSYSVPGGSGNHPTAVSYNPSPSVFCAIVTDGIGVSLTGSAYQNPINAAGATPREIKTHIITPGATPTVTRIQDAPSPDNGKVGSHSSTTQTPTYGPKIVSLGARVFALDQKNAGDNTVWELDLFTGTWAAKSWTHPLRQLAENIIVTPCPAYGGFLGIQWQGDWTLPPIMRVWKPGA